MQQNEYDVDDVKNEEILQDSHLESLFDNCNWLVWCVTDPNIRFWSKCFSDFSESKTTNDFFKSELNYDTVADQTNFVKEMFRGDETNSRLPDDDAQMTDTTDQSEIVVTTEKVLDHSEKSQVCEVRPFLILSISR